MTVSSPTRLQSRVVEGLRGQQGFLPPFHLGRGCRPHCAWATPGSSTALMPNGTQQTCVDLYRTGCNDLSAIRSSRPEGWKGPPGTDWILFPIHMSSSRQSVLRTALGLRLCRQAYVVLQLRPVWALSSSTGQSQN